MLAEQRLETASCPDRSGNHQPVWASAKRDANVAEIARSIGQEVARLAIISRNGAWVEHMVVKSPTYDDGGDSGDGGDVGG